MIFFKEMRSFFIIFIVFGLWSTWENYKYKSQINFHSICSVAIVFFCFFSAYFMNKFYIFNSLSNTVANVLYVLIIFTQLIIIAESILQKEAQMKLIQKLTIVDQMFNTKLNKMISYQDEKCEIFIRNSILVLIILFIKFFLSLFTYLTNREFNFMYPSMYPSTVMCFRLIQILYFVCLLRTRLHSLNDELQDIQQTLNMQTDQKRSKHSTKISLNRLMILKEIYGKLYDICDLINEAFGWSLLVFSTQHFIDFTCNCYWCYFSLFEFRQIIVSISLLIPIVTLFGTLSFYCSSCLQSVSRKKSSELTNND